MTKWENICNNIPSINTKHILFFDVLEKKLHFEFLHFVKLQNTRKCEKNIILRLHFPEKIPCKSSFINSEHLFFKNMARSRVCGGELAICDPLLPVFEVHK